MIEISKLNVGEAYLGQELVPVHVLLGGNFYIVFNLWAKAND